MNLSSRRPRDASRQSPSKRLLAMGVSLALTATLAGITAPSAHAAPVAGGSFSSSFETVNPQPLSSTAYGALNNVTGKKFSPGSLLGAVSTVTSQRITDQPTNHGDSTTTESPAKAADGVASTKWLTHSVTNTWLRYDLSTAVTAKKYTLTTANDSWKRNPKSWRIEGSNDNGATWDTLDAQSDQLTMTDSTPNFLKTYAFDMSNNNTAYSSYRFFILNNNGDSGIIQLGDWEILDGTSNAAAPAPIQTPVGSGPISAPVAKTSSGYTGRQALQYIGAHIASGAAAGTGVLYDNQDIALGDKTQLSYMIFPILDTSDLSYPATYTAVDLLLDDNTRVSAAGLVDSNGFNFDARSYGKSKALYGQQWNKVTVDLSSLAGRTVKKILLSYDNPDSTGNTAFSGWVDDLKIGDATPRDTTAGLVSYVDTRRGTNSNGSFSRGNNIPATAVPNGFNFFTPMTNASSQTWLYSYQNPTYVDSTSHANKLNGFGISHEPSPWMGDRNQIAFMPDNQGTGGSGNLDSRAKTYSHDAEIARPDYYSVFMDGTNLRTEIAPTDHGAVIRYTNNKSGDTAMRALVDVVSGDGSFAVDASGALTGWVDGGSGLSAGRSRMFIAGQYSTTPSTTTSGTGRTASKITALPLDVNKQVLLRVATSFISQGQAQLNLDREVTGKSFDTIRTAATQKWNDRLSVIDLAGSNATDIQKVTTYSNLYRLNLYPNSQSEDVSALGSTNPEIKYASPVAPKVGNATATQTNAQVKDGQIYVNNGFWDTYRTVWPLYSFLYPAVAQELVDGFVQQYRDGGWVARWSSPGYADLMTGTSSDASFAEAYTSGALDTATALEAYDTALKNATVLPTSSGVGRKGLDTSQFLGYTSTDTGESVSWGLEGLINDAAIGQMAAKLSTDTNVSAVRRAQLAEEAAYFKNRAKDYANFFDAGAIHPTSTTGFFQGRKANGDFELAAGAYDPTNWNNHSYTETDGWNFAFHAPFDVDGLAALYGGSAGLINKLDEFFATPETGTSRNIHETYEARDVRMGQFGMSNQVSHHIPWIYAAAGDPSKAQEKVREVLQRLFVGSEIGQGYPGDEDNGEMSSWQIFASLGFYPLSLGSGEFTIGSPLYDTVTVHRPTGNLTINAANNSRKNVYIAQAKLDNVALPTASLPQSVLNAAGNHTLDFTMSPTPTTWGDRTSNAPTPAPLTDISGVGYSTVVASDGSNTNNLSDNTSRTTTTFNTVTPSLVFDSSVAAAPVEAYTITNSDGASPTAWKLSGSNNGSTWTELDSRTGQQFRWATQTRPFQLSAPATFAKYKLSITATSDNTPAKIAEVELLAGQIASTALTLHAGAITAAAGTSTSSAYALISGGSSNSTADYQATVDFLDGAGPQAATVSASGLGLQVKLPHTFTSPGVYSVLVAVTENGVTARATATATVSRTLTLEAQFNAACLSNVGTAASCDGQGWSYDKAQLALPANGGFVQGTELTVPNTSLKYSLPVIADGSPDAILGEGQTFRLNVGTGATQYSFIGTANEGDQKGDATVTYSDGSTDTVPIEFGDWVGKSTAPAFGNIVVGKIQTRLQGSGLEGSNKTTAIYSTAPTPIPAGKTPVWVTLPNKAGSHASGKIHIFAVATDGVVTATPPLTATPSGAAVVNPYAGSPLTGELATYTGGDTVTTATASINWGDGTALGSGTIVAGVISGTHTYTTPGTYTVSVTVDDGVHSIITSREITVLAKVAPSVVLAGPATSPTTAATFDLTATVPSDATGTVEFFDGVVSLGTATITSGKAVLTVGPLTAGTHVTSAQYGGNGKYLSSTSASVNVAVVKMASTVAVTATPGVPVVNSTFTLTATVTAGATGTVEFFQGATSLGSGTISAGVATLSVTAPSATGTKSYTASYLGDSRYSTSTSAALAVNFSSTPAVVSLATSSTTATPVSSVTVTATVTAGATGTVTFFDGSVSLGTVQISANKAAKTLTNLAVGAHSITAVYSGDNTYGGATAPAVVITSSLAPSSVALTSSPGVVTPLTPVTLTATLTGPATGSVEFYDGTTKVATATASAGKATTVVNALTVGNHSFTAKFVGDASYATSTSPTNSITVAKVGSTTTLTSSATSTTTLGTVTFTATVPLGATGTVTFSDGTTVLGTKTVTATQNVVSQVVTGLASGSHSVTAAFSGDATYAASTSAATAVSVTKVASNLSVSADALERPSLGGSTLTATVNAGASGEVEFVDGSVSLGSRAIVAGTATLAVGNLTSGDHLITAKYLGDERFNGSDVAPVTITATAVAATVSLVASAESITDSGSVDLTATASAGATGSIEFFDGVTSLGVANLTDNAAALTVTGLTVGSHSIKAVYSGDQYRSTATSAALTVAVTASVTPKAIVTLSKPVFTKASQLYKTTKPVSVSTMVTGATSGTVTFKSGAQVLGKAAVKSGKATLKLSKTLRVGSYTVVASIAETNTTAAAISTAAASFKVKKSTISSLKVSGKTYAKGKAFKVTVKASNKLNSGAVAVGSVKVYVGKKVVKTVKTTTLRKRGGKVTVKISAKFATSSAVKVKAKFVPKSSTTSKSKASKTVKIKARR